MPQDFLRKIAVLPMPQTYCDPGSIDKIRVLRAAELVEAYLPAPGDETFATVFKVTALGRATAFKRPPQDPWGDGSKYDDSRDID